MIGKHLWTDGAGKWRAGESRTCGKCGAVVRYAAQPRGGARIFETTVRGEMVNGGMQPCEPMPPVEHTFPMQIIHVGSPVDFGRMAAFQDRIRREICAAMGIPRKT